MATEGKLGFLYTDKEQTSPLFPKTKTKAITGDDNVRLDVTLENLKTALNSKTSEAFVMNAIANAQLGGGEGEIDLSGYATKDELVNKSDKNHTHDLSSYATKTELNSIDFPVDSVNGKTGTVTLSAADVGAVPTSRTVNGKALSSNISLSASDVGARPSTWTPTASDVGAVAKNSLKTLSHSALDANGNTTLQTISTYPTSPGIYRVGASIAGLPDGNSGYGTLQIIDGGSYIMHLYVDMANCLYVDRTDSINTRPAFWRFAGGSRALWQNAAGSSAFGAQTITLNGYRHCNCILAIFKGHKNNGSSDYWHEALLPGTDGTAQSHILYQGTNEQHVARSFEWNDSGIYLGTGRYQQGTTLYDNNDFAIPIAFYGF